MHDAIGVAVVIDTDNDNVFIHDVEARDPIKSGYGTY